MRRWLPILLLAGVVALLVITNRPRKQMDDPATLTAEPTLAVYRLLPSITAPEQIETITLTIPSEAFAVGIAIDQAGRWYSLDDVSVTIDSNSAQEAREYAGLMPGLTQLQRGDTPAAEFGFLPAPQYVVRLQLANGSIATLYVGSRSPSGGAYFVSDTPDGVIIDLVPADWIDHFVMLMRTLALSSANVLPTTTP